MDRRAIAAPGQAHLSQLTTTKSLERWTGAGFTVLVVMEVSREGDRPCYVGFGQGQSLFFVSSNDTAASKRMDTNVFFVAILLLQRYPN